MSIRGYIQARSLIVANIPVVARPSAIRAVWLDTDGRTLESDRINVKTQAVKRLLLDEQP